MISSIFIALAIFSAVSMADIGDDLLNAGDEAALTDLLVRQSPGAGRVVAIIGQNEVADAAAAKPTYVPKRYGISKHQAFRFGKRLDNGLMLDGGDSNIATLVGEGQGGVGVGGSAGDANLNKYLNKFLEKHKTSGIFRWGRK